MSKLAIILCAAFFVSISNALDQSDLEAAHTQTLKEIDDAKLILNSKFAWEESDKTLATKQYVIANALWRDIREFLLNDNTDQEAKIEMSQALNAAINSATARVDKIRQESEQCSQNYENLQPAITCVKNSKVRAGAAALNIFPDLNRKVNELSQSYCVMKCRRSTSRVPTVAVPEYDPGELVLN